MNNEIYIIGDIGFENNLQSLIKQVDETDKDKPLIVNIHSGGGSVYDGLAMYNYLKGLDREVQTKSAGLVASIASIIFLAGSKETRVINDTDSFLIHLPMSRGEGNAKDLEKTAKELRDIEGKLADIYVNETNLTKEDAIALMEKDEMMDVNFLLEKGFVNEIVKFKAVASINGINNKNPDNSMNTNVTKEEVEGLFTKFFNKFFPKSTPTNKIVMDANGVEIDFTEIEDDGAIEVGAIATIEGAKAEGDYVMPEGETYVFTDGALTEIKPQAEEEEDEQAVKIEGLETDLAEATNEVAELKASLKEANEKFAKMENEFTEIKNSITSSFDYDVKDKKPETSVSTKRSLFKK